MNLDLETRVENLKRELCDVYCKYCKDPCCSVLKHTIRFGLDEAKFFTEKDVPIFEREELVWNLDEESGHFAFYLKEGSKIGPSLIDNGKDYCTLYAPFENPYCPFFEKSKGCLHHTEDRPNACKEYPMFVEEGKITVLSSCELMREKYVVKFLIDFFGIENFHKETLDDFVGLGLIEKVYQIL